MTEIVQFHGHELEVVEQEGRRALTAEEVGAALEYGEPRKAVLKILERNRDEFEEGVDCSVVKLTTEAGQRETTVFYRTGCALLGMFSKQPRAKEFRRWAKKILVGQQQAQASRPRQIEGGTSAEKLADLLMENRDLKKDLELLRAENAKLSDAKFQPYRDEVNKLAKAVHERDLEIQYQEEQSTKSYGETSALHDQVKKLRITAATLNDMVGACEERIKELESQDPDKAVILTQLHEAMADLQVYIKENTQLKLSRASLLRKLDYAKQREARLNGDIASLTLLVQEMQQAGKGGESHG